jgi:ribonucleoside-diphosphate reductase alpha chain
MRETGFLAAADLPVVVQQDAPQAGGAVSALGPLCPKCSQPGLVREAGCLSCMHCGWSKCG